MATYDKAYELARELKASEEYKEYQKAKQAILANETAMSILRDFREKQLRYEMEILSGKEPDEKTREEMQKLTDLVNLHGDVQRFLEAERRILIVMSDIQRILTDALNLLDYSR
ncbi:MAG TPA: YlbF family regulator [Firmicutes bacterium]|nr:YlbF family regulator [Candidatus Fermentithermobacillaceae bacterium]